jgi:hypothetical protein
MFQYCLNLCKDSYCPDKITFKNKNASGCSRINIPVLYISWTGTDNICDIFLDIRIIDKVPLIFNNKSYGKVGAGFFEYYKLLQKQTNNLIDEFVSNNGYNIVFTGHSLGASILFSALENKLKYNFLEIQVVTFGSPKLGNYYFKNKINKILLNNFRIYDENDLIPKLPLNCSYTHCGTSYKLLSKKKLNFFLVVYGFILYLFNKKITNNNILYHHTLENYQTLLCLND